MTKRIQVLTVLAIAAFVTFGWWIWVGRSLPVDEGHALASGGAAFRYGLTGIREGDEVYWMSPAPINESDEELTFIAATLEGASPGVDFTDARVYRRSDFPGGPPLMWGGKYASKSGSPGRIASTPLKGEKLAAGQTMDDFIFLHLRVSTGTLPAFVMGIRIEYQQGGKRRSQVMEARLELHDTPPDEKSPEAPPPTK